MQRLLERLPRRRVERIESAPSTYFEPPSFFAQLEKSNATVVSRGRNEEFFRFRLCVMFRKTAFSFFTVPSSMILLCFASFFCLVCPCTSSIPETMRQDSVAFFLFFARDGCQILAWYFLAFLLFSLSFPSTVPFPPPPFFAVPFAFSLCPFFVCPLPRVSSSDCFPIFYVGNVRLSFNHSWICETFVDVRQQTNQLAAACHVCMHTPKSNNTPKSAFV